MGAPLLRWQRAIPKSAPGPALPLTEFFVPRWLWILGASALIALIAGYMSFGGANMGR
jgi:hypothetical protein